VLKLVLVHVAKALDISPSEAQDRFDALMLVYKRGHLANVATLNRHPGVAEKKDKYIFIFSHGVTLPQVWHVDASLNITSSFCLFTRSLPTNVFAYVPTYNETQILLMAGVPAEFHAAVITYLRPKETGEVATNTMVVLDDLSALLPPYWTVFVDSVHNGIVANAGTIVSTHGAWPHCAPGSPDGRFRLALLVTTKPGYIWQAGYNTDVQHHRSQGCLYVWSFERAVFWLYADRVESHDAHLHWIVKSPLTHKVVKDFLAAALAWPSWHAAKVHAPLWERCLAAAFQVDGYVKKQGWPVWVPNEIRVPLTQEEKKTLAKQVAAGDAAKAKAAAANADAAGAAVAAPEPAP